ncbi:MAG: nucleotidyltransferase domain-containing protein [Nitrospirae bacterium]|nr:nucleotidyltransferase domain-containing protein [Nitrospirota bacterium]MCL5977887.1 nucleotidyltransferase domain-containing protein [Nitrospirota bacterium]
MENVEIKKFCEENDIELLILFGSHVSGKTRPESDVDVAVKFVGETEISKLELIYRLDGILDGKDIDLVVLTSDTEPLLLYEIFFNGRSLYERIPGIFDAERLRAWKLYIDTGKLRAMQKKYLKEFAARISNVA